jgi:hypothetical protein
MIKRLVACFVLIFSCGAYSAEQDRMINSKGGELAQDYVNARKLAVDRAESLSQGI